MFTAEAEARCCCCCRFINQHKDNKNYKAFLKALLKQATDPLTAEDAKEIENMAGTIRADKVKAEKAAAAAKKGGKFRFCWVQPATYGMDCDSIVQVVVHQTAHCCHD